MKRFICAALAAIMLFTSSGISAKSSTVVVESTNLATGDNVIGVVDAEHPIVITFSGNLHTTYNSAENALLNNIQMTAEKLNLSVSGKI